MKSLIENINSAKHIEIEVTPEYIALGSALYTYILTRHKKASFVCKTKEIDLKFSFLPWFEKIKVTSSSSADLNLKIDFTALELYRAFKSEDVKINPKMATALYGALILESENFTNSLVNGTIFATASELLQCGAEHKKCVEHLTLRVTLAELRLRSIMFKNMYILDEATRAEFRITQDDLIASGTNIDDAIKIIHEALKLEYIESVTLVKQNKIIKTVNKEI